MAKSKFFLLIPVVVMLVIVYWFVNKEKGPRDYSQISESGVLRIVTDYNSVGYFVSSDTVAGFNQDLIRLMESYIPMKVELFLESSLDKSIEGLKEGKYDVIARNIPVTSELHDGISFTEPIAQNRQVLVQRKMEYNDSIEPIRSHINLAKKTFYVPAKSPVILRIENLSHEIGDTIYIKEDVVYGAEQLIMMVASKDIDYVVCDEQIAAKVAKSLPEIDYATLIGFTHFEAWVVREDSPVLGDSLNHWIERMRTSPAYQKIYRKYYK